MIEFRDVTMDYGSTRVLGPVSGSIPQGGLTALIGPNGAGKSTLLTILGRLIRPTAGTVTVGGIDVHRAPPRDVAKALSILRQENHLTARLTVRDLVGFGRFPYSQGKLTVTDRVAVDQAMEFLGLDDLAGRFLDELSGGQRQRAFVAMVLAQETDYVLLDEPLNNLDIKHSVLMMNQLRRASTELGRTIVVVMHDLNFAANFADHLLAMHDGQITHSGGVAEIIRDDVLSSVFDTPIRVRDLEGQRTVIYTS